MLKIKLTKRGKKHQPSFRIIVAEARSKRDGQYIDLLGFYNPLDKPHTVIIDKRKYRDWIAKGAKPTPTVKRLCQS